jgi:hypothetical protein
LLSLANTQDAYIANLRVTNGGSGPIMIAGRALGTFYQGEFNLSDALGSSCPWRRAASQSLGTLPAAFGNPPINPANYRPVGAGQSVAVTLIFRKQFCESLASGDRQMILSGSFVVVQGDTPRLVSASFEGVAPTSTN